jgi:hypothetical protein
MYLDDVERMLADTLAGADADGALMGLRDTNGVHVYTSALPSLRRLVRHLRELNEQAARDHATIRSLCGPRQST